MKIDNKKEILDFIDLFKSANYGLIEKIYLNGGCYKLHLILKRIYPNAVPYKVSFGKNSIEHIITKIDDNFYDITGIFKMEKTSYKYIEPLNEKDILIAQSFKY